MIQLAFGLPLDERLAFKAFIVVCTCSPSVYDATSPWKTKDDVYAVSDGFAATMNTCAGSKH